MIFQKKVVCVFLITQLFLVVGIAHAVIIQVDTFDDGTSNLDVTIATRTDSDVVDASGIIGGERDVELFWGGGDFAHLYLDIDSGFFPPYSNRLAFTSGDGMTGTARIVWDGNDGAIGTPDYDGLCTPSPCEDLTDVDQNDGILMAITNNDLPINLILTVYDETSSSANYADYTLNLPGGIASSDHVDVFVPYSFFTGHGAWENTGTDSDWHNVGAIVLDIDGTLNESSDLSLDLFDSRSEREFGDVPAVFTDTVREASHVLLTLRLGSNVDTELSH